MTCATCPFFATLDGEPECRRNPPKMLTMTIVKRGENGLPEQGMNVQGVFPPTESTKWCGEHPQRKAQAEHLQLTAAMA